jgi:hypothetical protein
VFKSPHLHLTNQQVRPQCRPRPSPAGLPVRLVGANGGQNRTSAPLPHRATGRPDPSAAGAVNAARFGPDLAKHMIHQQLEPQLLAERKVLRCPD